MFTFLLALAFFAPPAPYAAPGPLPEARLFGEGVFSTRDDEFGGAFTPDGKTCFFTISAPRHYLYVIMMSRFDGKKWSSPEVAPFSGQYRDSDPVLSPDGSKIYFASDRPVDAKPKHDFDLWVVERTKTGWGQPKNLGAPVNSSDNEDFASVTRDGTLYFSSTRPGALGGEGDADIYRARLVDGKYAQVEHLGAGVSSESYDLDCLVAPDESFLLVGSYYRPGGAGNYDIFVSRNQNGTWSPAQSLGPQVNTTARDYSPRLSPDGKYLFFTSERDFSMLPRANPWTYSELEQGLRSTLNGSGNIYQIDLSVIGLGKN